MQCPSALNGVRISGMVFEKACINSELVQAAPRRLKC